MSDDTHPVVCAIRGCPRARMTADPGRWLRWSWFPDTDAQWRRLPDPKGERRRGPCAGMQRRPRGPRRARGGGTPKAGEQATPPRCASSEGAARGARFERCHERREVRTTMVAHDILWSDAIRAARVTTSICFCVPDGVLRRLLPPICIMSFDYCVLCLPHALFILKTVWFYVWKQSSYIILLHAYFLHVY
jgi:hypothetical protein